MKDACPQVSKLNRTPKPKAKVHETVSKPAENSETAENSGKEDSVPVNEQEGLKPETPVDNFPEAEMHDEL